MYLKQHKTAEARESFERAIKLHASYPDTLPNAWNNLGLLATQEGRTAEAIHIFKTLYGKSRSSDCSGQSRATHIASRNSGMKLAKSGARGCSRTLKTRKRITVWLWSLRKSVTVIARTNICEER